MDPTATPTPAVRSPGDVDPRDRGRLEIRDRALETIVVAAALDVDGVARSGGGLSRITGRALPRADVSTPPTTDPTVPGAPTVAVRLTVAVRWPYDVDALTEDLRDRVRGSLRHLAGTEPTAYEFTVAEHAPGRDDQDTEPPRRPSATHDPRPVAPLPPLGRPAVASTAALLAVAFLGLAVVAGRELLIVHERYAGAPWLRNTFEWFGRLEWETWIAPVAVLAVLVGLTLCAIALEPRRTTHIPARVADAVGFAPVTPAWGAPAGRGSDATTHGIRDRSSPDHGTADDVSPDHVSTDHVSTDHASTDHASTDHVGTEHPDPGTGDPRTTEQGPATVWLRRTDLARLCSARAGACAGVLSATTVVDRRRARVRVTADGSADRAAVDTSVRAAVGAALDGLGQRLEVVVEFGR